VVTQADEEGRQCVQPHPTECVVTAMSSDALAGVLVSDSSEGATGAMGAMGAAVAASAGAVLIMAMDTRTSMVGTVQYSKY
jgi:hypothetical protein